MTKTFKARYVSTWRRWQASDDDGVHCLHGHRSERAAADCAARLNVPRPTGLGTPQGAYEHAAGYQN